MQEQYAMTLLASYPTDHRYRFMPAGVMLTADEMSGLAAASVRMYVTHEVAAHHAIQSQLPPVAETVTTIFSQL